MNRTTSRRILAIFAMIPFFSDGLLAGVIRHDVPDSHYRSLADDSRYQSVGQITLQADDGNRYAASGSLISSNWILTAAHVVADALSVDFHIGGATYSAVNWIAHPNYASGGFSYDVGLVQLGEPLSSITPAARYTGRNELGKVGTFVGFGLTGNGLTGTDFTSDLEKRAGQNMIDVGFIDTGGMRNWRVFGVDFDSSGGGMNAYGSGTPLDLEYLTSFGDSGGGVFIEENGTTYLAGVHSFIVDHNRNGLWGDYGDVSGHVRVSAFNDWIDGVIGGGGGGGGGKGKGGGQGGGKKATSLMAPVPEPAGAFALLMFAGAMLMRRRA